MCQAAASGIEAVNILSELMKNGGTSFDAILIDHAMTHSSSLKEVSTGQRYLSSVSHIEGVSRAMNTLCVFYSTLFYSIIARYL